jgi:aminoglycoside N3'-acetyltransferase
MIEDLAMDADAAAKQTVTSELIASRLCDLGLSGKPVVVHSSLRSFGRVHGGPEAVIKALQYVCPTVLMPGFQCAAKILPPPEMRYRQNGCDYAVHFDFVNPPRPFDVNTAPIHPQMGIIAHTLAKADGVSRSDHPWHSWLGTGKDASDWLADHPWDSPNRPLETLADAGGFVVLLGVGLASCTAVHVAEERLGRRPFVRWAKDRMGAIREVKTNGCAKGFDALMPYCRDVFRVERIGSCVAQTANVRELLDCLAPVIRAQPEITRCSVDCLRCHDAVLGGPLPPETRSS